MILEINNFGRIDNAKINLGKINIIAGPNKTGKTTSSKIIYCLLASLSSDGTALLCESIKSRLEPAIMYSFGIVDDYDDRDELMVLTSQLNNHFDNILKVKKIFDDFKLFINVRENIKENNRINELVTEIERIFDLNEDKYKIHRETLSILLNKEFDSNSIAENFGNSHICFKGIDKCEFSVEIFTNHEKEGNKFLINKDLFKCFDINEVVYLETPYILDLGTYLRDLPFTIRTSNFHQEFLVEKLEDISNQKDVFDKVFNRKIDKILEKIDEIIGGSFYFDEKRNQFIFKENEKEFAMKDTSSGVKQIGLIQMLLANRKLPEGSYLIMDEPEVHLHPEWQLKLAEIIVLLSQETNMVFYINSHSPQFVEAIETYSTLYNFSEEVNFHLAELSHDKKDWVDIKPVEKKDIIKIYDNLGNPYDELDRVQGKIIANNLK